MLLLCSNFSSSMLFNTNKYAMIYIDYGSTVSISGSTFENNTAQVLGGAVYSGSANTVYISHSIFTNNLCASLTDANAYGGAIHNTGYMTINYTSFTNNTAVAGGAIYSHGTLVIGQSYFINNYANSYGGAIQHNNNLTVEDIVI